MLIGDSIIRECSSCSGHIIQPTLASGNTLGAIYWTDGWMYADMLPDSPLIVKCPHCGALLRIYDQKEIGKMEAWMGYFSPPKDMFKDSSHFTGSTARDETQEGIPKCFVLPSFEDYVALQNEDNLNRDMRMYLVQHAWWVGNDIRRDSLVEVEFSKAEKANLEKFIELLDVSNEDQAMYLVEIYR
ncbi:MAG: hypothetical protein PHY48_04135 [Candidatus Cloacimonetes bacterium]|nr:hypothetical protein [Candidatus Cloacimonadota bacterium]